MKKLLLFAIFSFHYYYSGSQTVVIKQSPPKDTVRQEKTAFWGGGFMFDVTLPICETLKPEQDPAFSPTYSRSLGIRVLPNVKYHFNDEMAAVLHFGYTLDNYGFTTDRSQTSFPDSTQAARQKFSFSSATVGLGFRFTSTEDRITEVGMLFNYALSRSYQYEQKNAQNQVLEITSPSPSYLTDNYSTLYLRFGYEGLSLIATYRISDLILSTSAHPNNFQLPPVQLGVTIGL